MSSITAGVAARAADCLPGPGPGPARPAPAAAGRRPGIRPSQVPVSQPEDAADRAADAVADRAAPKPAVFGAAERSPAPVAPGAVWAAIGWPGRRLADHERPLGLGAELSQVRIHADHRAADSARMLGAAAYTFGEDVVLGDGVDTRTAAGRRILAHELAHVVQQRGRPSPAIMRQGVPRLRPSARPATEDLGAKVQRIWDSLLAFSDRAPAAVHSTLLAVEGYIERYDRAFASFEVKLSQAQRELARREMWRDVLSGIVVGAALGVGAAGLLRACEHIKEIVEESRLLEFGFEAGVHTADSAADAATERLREAVSREEPEFKAPRELQADHVARELWERVARASDGVSLTLSAIKDLSAVRDRLRGGHPVAKPEQVSAWLDKVAAAVADANRSVTLFRTAVDTPLLLRSDEQISQDLWIRWMAESPANAEWAGLRPPGVAERLVPGKWQEKEAVHLARDEVERLNMIGRLGVVVVPPRATPPGNPGASLPGVVRLRHDAYGAAGRLEPPRPEPETVAGAISKAASGEEPFVRIAWEGQTYLRAGEVVLIYSTSASGVLAHRFGTAPLSLPVSRDEQAWAFGMIGIDKPEHFHPEAAAGLHDAVWAAVNDVLPPQFVPGTAGSPQAPRADVIDTEDGVMVVDYRMGGRAGTRIVLFAPLASERTEDYIQVAQERRKRTGVFKVVAIDLRNDPHRIDRQKEIRQPGVVITSAQDADLRKEILDALPQGPSAISRLPVPGREEQATRGGLSVPVTPGSPAAVAHRARSSLSGRAAARFPCAREAGGRTDGDFPQAADRQGSSRDVYGRGVAGPHHPRAAAVRAQCGRRALHAGCPHRLAFA